MGATTQPTLGCPATRTASAVMLVSVRQLQDHQGRWSSERSPGHLGSLLLPLFPPGWRLFDDSTVTMVEESQVVTRYAYVLFYRRRNSPVERPAPFHRPGGAESPTAAGAAASQVRPRPDPCSPSGPWEPQRVCLIAADSSVQKSML